MVLFLGKSVEPVAGVRQKQQNYDRNAFKNTVNAIEPFRTKDELNHN